MDSPSSPNQLTAYQTALDGLVFGKRLPTAVYILDEPAFVIPGLLWKIAEGLRGRLQLGAEFNLLKFSTRELKLSFLSYPDVAPTPLPRPNPRPAPTAQGRFNESPPVRIVLALAQPQLVRCPPASPFIDAPDFVHQNYQFLIS